MVFILDEHAPHFSLSEPLYADQLRLQLQVQVLRGGQWGRWSTLPLSSAAPAALSASRWDRQTQLHGAGSRCNILSYRDFRRMSHEFGLCIGLFVASLNDTTVKKNNRKFTTTYWKICFRLAVVNLQQNVVSFYTSP